MNGVNELFSDLYLMIIIANENYYRNYVKFLGSVFLQHG